jgi:hypothetical protein
MSDGATPEVAQLLNDRVNRTANPTNIKIFPILFINILLMVK